MVLTRQACFCSAFASWGGRREGVSALSAGKAFRPQGVSLRRLHCQVSEGELVFLLVNSLPLINTGDLPLLPHPMRISTSGACTQHRSHARCMPFRDHRVPCSLHRLPTLYPHPMGRCPRPVPGTYRRRAGRTAAGAHTFAPHFSPRCWLPASGRFAPWRVAPPCGNGVEAVAAGTAHRRGDDGGGWDWGLELYMSRLCVLVRAQVCVECVWGECCCCWC